MTVWNMVMILCLAILYLGTTLVYLQIRKLRDELRSIQQATHSNDPALDRASAEESARGCAEAVIREVSSLEKRLTRTMEDVAGKILPELQDIQRELRYLERGGNSSGSGGMMGSSASALGGEESSNRGKSDSYHEARLLLANGVDEEQVIEQTGLTVEEVSLLKRLSDQDPEDDEGY
ncbi:MAG: hypothetical protein HQL50_07850 [Magnetococcales bacterium]|nr:hypothetical protein [Magnetococcales bacterium]